MIRAQPVQEVSTSLRYAAYPRVPGAHRATSPDAQREAGPCHTGAVTQQPGPGGAGGGRVSHERVRARPRGRGAAARRSAYSGSVARWRTASAGLTPGAPHRAHSSSSFPRSGPGGIKWIRSTPPPATPAPHAPAAATHSPDPPSRLAPPPPSSASYPDQRAAGPGNRAPAVRPAPNRERTQRTNYRQRQGEPGHRASAPARAGGRRTRPAAAEDEEAQTDEQDRTGRSEDTKEPSPHERGEQCSGLIIGLTKTGPSPHALRAGDGRARRLPPRASRGR
ncbi:hypothetical protein ACVW0K_007360 [Streptomyces filamentosus]